MRKRGVKSPDRAEALMLAFAQVEPGLVAFYRRENEQNAALQKIVGMDAPSWMLGVMNAKCAKCQKPLPPNSLITQSRGLKFCSVACSW